jgi:hypothetical protein
MSMSRWSTCMRYTRNCARDKVFSKLTHSSYYFVVNGAFIIWIKAGEGRTPLIWFAGDRYEYLFVCIYVYACMHVNACIRMSSTSRARTHTHTHSKTKKITLAENAPQTHSLSHTHSLTHTHIYPRIYFSSLDNKFWVPSNTVVVREREKEERERQIFVWYTQRHLNTSYSLCLWCARGVCARVKTWMYVWWVYLGGWAGRYY